MKILQKSKRALPPLPQVAELINKLHNTPNDELHEVLSEIDVWKWPRSDLNAWIKVLNKFDAILEEYIRDYEVDKVQVNVFTPITKKTICEILRFERLLLENSTNRKTFSSYDRINSFLSSSDLDVVVLALNLLLRPAQQYSAQPAVTRALSISTPRLQSLAKRWSNLREYGVSLVDLVTESGKHIVEELPSEAREVHFSFYKTDSSKDSKPKEMDIDTVPEVPATPVRRPSATAAPTSESANPPPTSGAVNIHIDAPTLESKPTMDILADVIEKYDVPEPERFELMCRIRTAQVLFPGRDEDREKVVIVRLLANAIFVHTHPESQAMSSLFLYEPDLIPHIAELLGLDRGVPVFVQTAAIAALDAMVRYRTKVQDVITAVNAGVNHGTLMALLRKTVNDVANPDSTLPQSFVDSLLSFVTFLASHAAGGNMVVGAGLVPLLIQIIENRLPQRLSVVSRAMQLVDNVLYSFANAFQLFCNNKGVDVLVDRIQYEIDLDIKEHGSEDPAHEIPKSYGQLPVVRAAVLKHILRSMHRMMQSSGTAEGLRGLIDSSLLKSIQKVMEHRSLFGPSVLPIAINIMATFVHNEPTSLAIIQEAGLPETFYKTVDAGLEPVIEVIQSIPNAIGALCLNQAGQDQLTARPTIIPGLFSIFTSERHQRVLQDKENAVLIGTTVDELIRHHPMLKTSVFEAIKSTLSKIEDLGNAYVVQDNVKQWYKLLPPSTPAAVPSSTAATAAPTPIPITRPTSAAGDGDVAMEEATESTAELVASTPAEPVEPAAATTSGGTNGSVSSEDTTEKSHENTIISYIDVLCRFLEGLFQHTSHCKDFISNSDALERLGRLTALPCLPYDFGNSVASDSLVQVIRTMVEAAPAETMTYLAKLVRTSLDETKEFWASQNEDSKLMALLEEAATSEVSANQSFRKLVTLHIRVTLLSDIYSTAGYAPSRGANSLLSTLMGKNAPEIIPDLGTLHRVCVWENVVLKSKLPSKNPSGSFAGSLAPLLQSPTSTLAQLDGEGSAAQTNGAQPQGSSTTPAATPKAEGEAKPDNSREENGKALKHLANQIPSILSPFFQAVVKLFSTRRNPEPSQKQQILSSAGVVADILIKHLTPIEAEDRLLSMSYHTFMLGLVTTLIADERNSQYSLHTVLLDAFYRKSGLDGVVNLCHRFMAIVEEISKIKPEDRSATVTQELIHAYGGIKVALHLLHPLVSPKPIFESSQTIILLSREKKETDPDYFEPHNFLVKLRIAVLPLTRELWEAEWLAMAPHSLIRSVVQVILEIVNGDGEEGQTEGGGETTFGGLGGIGGSLLRAAATVPDENRIRQLTDMGFPRPAAESALTRTHNNVNAATEFLLANPFRFPLGGGAPAPAEDEGEGDEGQDETMEDDAPEPPAAEGQADAAPPAEPAPETEPASTETTAPVEEKVETEEQKSEAPVKTPEQWRTELNTARESLKADIGRLSLRLVDEHPALIFDIHHAFIGRPDGYQKQSIRLLIDDIKEFSPQARGEKEQALAVRFRLLALVLNDAPASFKAVLSGSTGERQFMGVLLELLKSNPVDGEGDAAGVAKWLAAMLLVSEAMLTLGEEPRTISLPKEGEPVPEHSLATGPLYLDARPALFDLCIKLLSVPKLTRDDLLASLRLLVLFTRDHYQALAFVERGGIPLLFQALKSSSGGVAGSQSYITIILRHIVEDDDELAVIMRNEIARFLLHPRTRVIDVPNYIRHLNSMALRFPIAFIKITSEMCKLDHPYGSPHHVSLKEEEKTKREEKEKEKKTAEAKPDAKEPGGDVQMQVDVPLVSSTTPSAPPEHCETLIHFLLGELIRVVKTPGEQGADVPNTQSTSASATTDTSTTALPPSTPRAHAAPSAAEEKPAGSTESPPAPAIDYFYSGFLMQCLTELLFSYDFCKTAFLSYSPKKRAAGASKEATTKHRTAALHFLLNDLVSYGTVGSVTEHQPEEYKRVTLCNWAMSVIVALCVDANGAHDLRDLTPEIVSTRKFVLEAVSRAIKDPAPSDSVDARYGRMLALADLCQRLLTVRFNSTSRKPQPVDENPTHIAKIMLEKNFVATLTTALAEVDLNFPGAKSLVACILKPLELLSKIAIKMSRTSDKVKGSEEVKADLEDLEETGLSDEEDDMDDQGDETREETPDLYRNSSLGMFAGDMEDQYAEEDGDDDEEDMDEDVEMDFGEDTGSEATTEEDEEDEIENGTGESEAWQDEDDEDEEDLVENEEAHMDEVDEDDEDDDEGDDEEEDEGTWEDLDPGPLVGGAAGEEDDVGVNIPIHYQGGEEEDDEEGGMGSEEDDLGAELGIIDAQGGATAVDDVFGLGGALADGNADFMEATGGMAGMIFSGATRAGRPRAEDDDMEIFGRSRPAPAPAPEVVTHPLLLESADAAARTPSGQGRTRRGQRNIFAAGTPNDLLQAIEDIIGGGAVHLFQHFITNRDPRAPEAIRLDVPPGALINLNQGLMGRRQHAVSAQLRIERAPRAGETPPHAREFDPFSTLQRWGEEAKVLHGKFSAERFMKLANHLILSMLPDAIERQKEAKAKEEKEAAERREAEAKAEAEAKEEAEKAAAAAAEKAREEEEAKARQEAEASTAEAAAPAVATEDVDMTDAAQEHPAAPEDAEAQAGPSEPAVVEAEGSGEASTSAAPERVTVMIHGSAVDITDTGIDPTFLEALPDDMREEVVNQHIRDQRAARVERPPDSQISSEFLDALPPEIRAEILQQERVEQARRRAEERAANPGSNTAAEIDPASFIASLDPQLRQDVLMDQDDGFISSLPAHMIAEAGTYRDRAPRRTIPRQASARSHDPHHPAPPAARKPPAQRDAIQLLDKSGIAVLVRLLFFPQILKKNTLFKVLVNLCENSKTRTELFNLLLNILQDGATDLAAIDRSFSQMTVRASKPPQTPRTPGKQRAGSDYFSSLPVSHLPSEIVPDLIAQRCLEALTYIVTSNELSSLFFLTEHELSIGLKRSISRKGKGKEKQAPQTQYPIVLLLGLLDRQSLLKTPSMLESVVSLLDTVTRPLTSLKDAQKKAVEPPKAESTTTAPESASAPASSEPAPVSAAESTAPSTDTQIAAVAPAPVQPAQPAPEAPKDSALTGETMEEKILLANPPQIPHSVLRLIVNILTVGECGAKPFHHSLSLIQHLSYIPDAREVIAQELRAKTQDFGTSLHQDLEELSNALSGSQGDVLASSVASKFSSPSSDQAKLLRVLKTIDYMYSPKSGVASTSETDKGDDTEKIQAIYESFSFTPLWRRLGDCLSVIEQRPEIEHIATVLLPLIESLMVVCKYVGATTSAAASTARALRGASSPKSPTTPRESMEDLFVTFTDDHRKVLNVMVRNNPSLMSGSFSLLVHNPRVLDFDNKRNYFNQQLRRRPHSREHHGTLQLNVRRQRLFEDSFQYLQRKTGDQIKYGKLSVRFYDEEGVDAGGVTREWFQILARQMFDPNNALFEPCAADKLTYQPNKASWVNPEHLSFFKFVGRVIGKAIYDGRLLDAYFARSLYRQILGKPVDYRDVEWIDPDYYKSLCWILENDPTALDMTFSVEGDEFGVMKIVPLKEGGETLPVTLENRREFVQLAAQYRLYSSIKDQIENLLSGFYDIIPKDLVSIFNEQELELLISGTPEIDVDEWRAATDYNGYNSSDPVIVWWWRALKSFNRDERAKVLSFATGTSRVPLSGFGDLQGVQGTQRFSIHRAYGDPDRLPQAHTCFNQIDLPQYSSYEKLRQQLLLAINEGGEGFGFA